MRDCDVGFLASADGIIFVVHCFFHICCELFLRWDVGNVTVFFISKICYRARCLRAQVMGHVVVAAFWMWGVAWQ